MCGLYIWHHSFEVSSTHVSNIAIRNKRMLQELCNACGCVLRSQNVQHQTIFWIAMDQELYWRMMAL